MSSTLTRTVLYRNLRRVHPVRRDDREHGSVARRLRALTWEGYTDPSVIDVFAAPRRTGDNPAVTAETGAHEPLFVHTDRGRDNATGGRDGELERICKL